MCIEQELVVMRSRFRLIDFTFVMNYGLEKSMKRNVENPDFGSDSIFFAFPIKRINFWGLQHTCTAAACKNRCIKLIRLFSPGRAVYWVLFVYFGHQSSKKEIDQIGIGRIAL